MSPWDVLAGAVRIALGLDAAYQEARRAAGEDRISRAQARALAWDKKAREMEAKDPRLKALLEQAREGGTGR